MAEQLECRVVIIRCGHKFEMGMYDPLTMRYECLGKNHPAVDEERIVRGLVERIEREGHRLSFCERTERLK